MNLNLKDALVYEWISQNAKATDARRYRLERLHQLQFMIHNAALRVTNINWLHKLHA